MIIHKKYWGGSMRKIAKEDLVKDVLDVYSKFGN